MARIGTITRKNLTLSIESAIEKAKSGLTEDQCEALREVARTASSVSRGSIHWTDPRTKEKCGCPLNQAGIWHTAHAAEKGYNCSSQTLREFYMDFDYTSYSLYEANDPSLGQADILDVVE